MSVPYVSHLGAQAERVAAIWGILFHGEWQECKREEWKYAVPLKALSWNWHSVASVHIQLGKIKNMAKSTGVGAFPLLTGTHGTGRQGRIIGK